MPTEQKIQYPGPNKIRKGKKILNITMTHFTMIYQDIFNLHLGNILPAMVGKRK